MLLSLMRDRWTNDWTNRRMMRVLIVVLNQLCLSVWYQKRIITKVNAWAEAQFPGINPLNFHSSHNTLCIANAYRMITGLSRDPLWYFEK